MKWAVVALNHRSIEEARGLREACLEQSVDNKIHIYTIEKYMAEDLQPLSGGLKRYNETLFESYRVIVYVCAMGIIVRDIAPYLKHKSVDPAVLCLSVDGRYIIPVISGHLGGANEIALEISDLIGAEAIITTASDVLGKSAVDMIAKANDLVIASFKDAKDLTAMMINEELVEIVCEAVCDIDGQAIQAISGVIEGKTVESTFSEEADGVIYIGYKKVLDYDKALVRLLAKRLVLGIGARRDTPYLKIKTLFERLLEENNIDQRCFKAIASLDLKADEEGIIKLSQKLKVPFKTYSAEELSEVVERFDQSEFVKKTTGVGAVCMPSGYLASDRGRCLMSKVAEDGMTMSVWEVMK